MFVKIYKSNNKNKKLKAVFYDKNNIKITTIHFGAKGYEDYTIHKDNKRKLSYLNRHSKENWKTPMSAGSLSRYILWGPFTDLKKNIEFYKALFNLG